MTTIVVDTETNGLLRTVSKLWQISIIDVDTEELVSYNDYTGKGEGRDLWAGLKRMEEADTIIMHNGLGYDLPMIRLLYKDMITLDWRKVVDTLVLSRLGNPNREGGHSVEAWAYRLDDHPPKVEHEDWSKWSPDMENRCNVDTRINLGIYHRLRGMYDVMPEAVQIEHAAAHEVAKCINRGFRLDLKYTEHLLSDLLSEQEVHREKMGEIFPPILVPKSRSKPEKTLKVINKRHPLCGYMEPGSAYCPLEVEEFNPGSRPQIARRLIDKYGWKPRRFTPGGAPEVNEDILRDLAFPEAEICADYLSTDMLIRQINAPIKSDGSGGGWLVHLQPDGKVHAGLQSLKAVTGRLACSGPNIQQVSSDTRMRRAWIPSEGKRLVGIDAEGLELRCLAHYLEPYDGGEYARILLEGDIHTHVQNILGFYSRTEVKRAEYGWLYGAGDAKLGIIMNRDAYLEGKPIQYDVLGLEVKRKQPSNTVVGKAMRSKLETGITGLGEVVRGVKSRVNRTGKLKGLDGRTLWIRSEHSALNFLLQSAGIIICKKAWSMVEDELTNRGLVEDVDYGLVMQIHDEFQYETTPEAAVEVGEAVAHCIVRAGEELGFGCPTSGSYKIGDTWADTH